MKHYTICYEQYMMVGNDLRWHSFQAHPQFADEQEALSYMAKQQIKHATAETRNWRLELHRLHSEVHKKD